MSGTMAQPTSTALLEELRQRIRSEYAPPPMTDADRLAAFGRGVLSNRGSFLENLTAGLASQEQAAAARAEQQRRALDMERQAVEQAVREQLERDRLAQSQSQFEAEGPVREARTDQARAYAEYLRQGGRGGGAAGRDPTPAALRTATVAANQALQAAIRQAGNAVVPRTLSQEEQDTIWQTAYNRSIQGQGVQAPAGVPTPDVRTAPAPAATVDARGNPIR
jgi:hypothetical protein